MVTPTTFAVPPLLTRGLVLSGDRTSDVVAFESEVVDYFVDAADLLGVPRSVAAIYGLVFASPEPLSFAEINERLDISKGSISQGLRVLREVGALKEVSVDSERSERFEPDLELRKLVLRFLERRLQAQLEVGKSRLAALKRSVPSADKDSADILLLRLISLSDWQAKADQLLPVAKTFLKLSG